MFRTRTTAVAGIPLAIALSLTACSGPMSDPGNPAPDSSTTAQAALNPADLAFTMMMIPHHEQAIEMADVLLATADVDERVRDLAQRIKDAQQPEIDTMTAWLDAGMSSPGTGGMDHGGMMSNDDMAALESAAGREASQLFLEQMIEHHRGAILMAQDELRGGSRADVVDLAQRILDSQTAEIAEMQSLLHNL